MRLRLTEFLVKQMRGLKDTPPSPAVAQALNMFFTIYESVAVLPIEIARQKLKAYAQNCVDKHTPRIDAGSDQAQDSVSAIMDKFHQRLKVMQAPLFAVDLAYPIQRPGREHEPVAFAYEHFLDGILPDGISMRAELHGKSLAEAPSQYRLRMSEDCELSL